jgi:hypothetical protein
MNNLMSGDNSGAEPREHDPRCRTFCTSPLRPRSSPVPTCGWGHQSHECDCDEIATTIDDTDPLWDFGDREP